MLKKLKQSEAKGFTIIEVMIVLAIAGLILLIVFLAVPALQRNGRNTALKNDAGNIAGAISEYRSNNDGGNPAAVSSAGVVSGTGTSATAKISSTTTVSATASPTVGTIGVMVNTKCDASANNRSVAVYYFVEQSSGGAIKCIEA